MSELDEWEGQRRDALRSLMEDLGAGDLDPAADPLAFLPVFQEFVDAQDFGGLDEDDRVWLHSMLGAYLSEVLIRRYDARWWLSYDERGPAHLLVAEGPDRRKRGVSPMDVAYAGIASPPVVLADLIRVAEQALNPFSDRPAPGTLRPHIDAS